MSDTIFHQIMRGEIPAEMVYDDDICFAIRDVSPQAPVHLLLIPKVDLTQISEANDAHHAMLGHLMTRIPKIMIKEVGDAPYRVVINNGEGAGQSVFQLHIHLLSGRSFSWPPG